MKSMRLLSAVFGVFALHTPVAPPANASNLDNEAETYSAIAEYSDNDSWAVGYALGYATQARAEQRALAECNSKSQSECRIVEDYTGPGCTAIAKASNNAGGVAYQHPTESAATERALRKCQRAGGTDCTVTAAACVEQAGSALLRGDVVKSDSASLQENDVKSDSASLQGNGVKSAIAALTPKCNTPTRAFAPPCWQKVKNQPDCYIWAHQGNVDSDHKKYDLTDLPVGTPLGAETNQTLSWSGQCKNGVAVGSGTIVALSMEDGVATKWKMDGGTIVNGRMNGRWSGCTSLDLGYSQYIEGRLISFSHCTRLYEDGTFKVQNCSKGDCEFLF